MVRPPGIGGRPGASVSLTIDETIQYIAQKELARGIAETHAKAGTVVIQDPNSGELLGVANWPTFDPNNPGDFSDDARMDRAVSAAYEPGSTFKIITVTGAIENGVASPDEMIDCQMGKILLAGRVIHDWHPFGVLSVQQILEHSSDVGAIKVALKLGAPRFFDTIRAFGIGQLTGIELPGENRGLLRPLEDWSGNSIGSLAMGQEVSVTPIQIISAISAVANGGTWYRPRILREIGGNAPEGEHPAPEPRQVTDERTAAEMREMMEHVVLEGTGMPARLDGYTAAGKSGTAQKIDPATGRYSATQYNASFVGFAPVNEPAVTILVVLDSPIGVHHGGQVGGPIFKRIAEQVLAYLEVPHDIPGTSNTETAKNLPRTPNSASHPSMEEGSSEDAAEARFQTAIGKDSPASFASAAGHGDQRPVTVPSLAGQTVRGVVETCSHLGLMPSLIGDGVALEQFPGAGTQVARGSRVTVRFGRPGVLRAVSTQGDGN